MLPNLLQKSTFPLLAFSLILLQSCDNSFDRIEEWENNSPPTVGQNIDELVGKAGFDFHTTETKDLVLSSLNAKGTAPVANVGVEVYTTATNGDLNLIAVGNIDDSGSWRPTVSIPSDLDSLTLKVTTPGFAQWHKIAAQSNVINYTFGSSNTSGRIIQDPILIDPESGILKANSILESRSGYNYIGTVDANGVPTYLTTPADVGDNVLDFIAANLPEERPVPSFNPQYLEENISSNIIFEEDGELWVSFLHEGAGYRNSVGYFTFDPNNPPRTISDIDARTIMFPNSSFMWSGGGLQTGDRIYLGSFEKGTGVGWFLVPNGWNSGSLTVNESYATRYSIEDLNTFTSEESRSHALLLGNEKDEFLIVAFEDLNRPYGDNDFNDAIFLVEATPFSAISLDNTPEVVIPGNDEDNDGVPDHLDAFPLDDERAYISFTPASNNFGTIAFEDLWPRKGDYDFNDMVIKYSFVETLDADQRVKDIELSLVVSAMGASQNHGFAMRLPISPSMVESTSGQVLNNNYFDLNANGTETGMSMAVIPMFTDGFSLFESVETGGIVNTDPNRPKVSPGLLNVKITFVSPIDRDLIGSAPYDPFMLRKQDRSLEVHLAGYSPTERADLSLFNTDDDKSDLESGFCYVDSRNLPWAIHVPESFIYPQERIPITEVYENFATWATYGGESGADWFRNTGSNVNSGKGY